MGSDAVRSVLWREGMFLCPQHFQAYSREVGHRVAAGDRAGNPACFGLYELDVDTDSLERDVFEVVRLRAILRDGTYLSLGSNASVLQREFGESFTGSSLLVYLGVVADQANVPQIGSSEERTYRFTVEELSVFDENERDSGQDLEFRTFNARLFFGDEDRSGFDTIPIARLIRVGQPEAVSALCPKFVPPCVRVGAVRAFTDGLEELADQARSQSRDLAATLPDTTRLSSVQNAADLTGLVKLQAANRSTAILEQLCAVPDTSPATAYLELVRIAGDLAIFRPDRLVPEMPGFDQDRLDEVLQAIFESIRGLLGAQVAVPYDRVDFVEDKEQAGVLYAGIPPEWMSANPGFYLGVEIEQSHDQAAELVAAGVKLLAPDDLEHVLQGVLPGVALRPLRLPPPAFPNRSDLHFFEIVNNLGRQVRLGVVHRCCLFGVYRWFGVQKWWRR